MTRRGNVLQGAFGLAREPDGHQYTLLDDPDIDLRDLATVAYIDRGLLPYCDVCRAYVDAVADPQTGDVCASCYRPLGDDD